MYLYLTTLRINCEKHKLQRYRGGSGYVLKPFVSQVFQQIQNNVELLKDWKPAMTHHTS